MFLVNSPPVAAFPSQWMPFGPKGSRKVRLNKIGTLCQASKPAHLLGILNGQQSDDSSNSMSAKYERIMQKNKKGELSYNRGLKSNIAHSKGHPKARPTFPAQLNVKKEGPSKLRTPDTDSDSDDSVDRDIEEAIQEYLKNKGTADSCPNAVAAKSPGTNESNLNKPLPASSNAPARRSPVKMVTSAASCSTFLPAERSRCSSSESGVDSDDSFEQSISDEIRQFLSQKKLQNSTSEAGDARNVTQSTATAKPKQKNNKAAEKQSPKRVNKGLLDKPPSESSNLQPSTFKQKTERFKANPASSCSVRPIGPRKETIQSAYDELSDSSSDDGIEEAIQLYQLEKSRLEGNVNAAPKQSPERSANITASTTANFSPCQEKNTSPDSDNRKRRSPFSRQAATQDPSSCHVVTPKRALYPGDHVDSKCEAATLATRRAETAAELMCAEAILDISKAILPSQPETTFVISEEMPPAAPPAPSASDDSDSDDSIEQEIRTFLARKAESESIGTAPAKPLSSDHRKLSSNNQKQKLTENKAVQKEVPGQSPELERRPPAEDICVAAGTGSLLKADLQAKCSEMSIGRCKPAIKSEEDSIIQAAAESLVLLPGLTGSKRKTYTKTRGNSSGDKSSSLDSDEDLDSAIKDLLRSKRKIKKRPKDGRAPCKKKVRFGETTHRPLESLGHENLKDCLPKPAAPKSCLVNSNEQPEEALKKLKTNAKVETASLEVSSNSSPNKPECRPVSASDKSSSALPEAQDSSSVDSDDSIEQEIRKFLAERARESAELSAMQKATANVATSNAVEPSACLVTPPPAAKQEPRVLSISETETILQKVMEKDRSNVHLPQPAARPLVQACKDVKPQVRLLQRPPVEVPKVPAPVHSVIVQRECVLEPSRAVRPAEKILPPAPERINVKPEVNSSLGGPAVTGNFVAGLKYISGTDQQLLLNMGKASATRVAAELYSPGATVAKLGTVRPVQKKTLILEPPKIVPAPAFSLGNPMVRPALYVVTTKMVKDAPATLCLPINAATYDAGLNLMSIQYCQGQVAQRASVCATPFPFQPSRAGEIVMNIPSAAREALPFHTKERANQSAAGLAGSSCIVKDSSARDVGTGPGHGVHGNGSSAKRHSL